LVVTMEAAESVASPGTSTARTTGGTSATTTTSILHQRRLHGRPRCEDEQEHHRHWELQTREHTSKTTACGCVARVRPDSGWEEFVGIISNRPTVLMWSDSVTVFRQYRCSLTVLQYAAGVVCSRSSMQQEQYAAGAVCSRSSMQQEQYAAGAVCSKSSMQQE
jgi:hypothetical protein